MHTLLPCLEKSLIITIKCISLFELVFGYFQPKELEYMYNKHLNNHLYLIFDMSAICERTRQMYLWFVTYIQRIPMAKAPEGKREMTQRQHVLEYR